MSISPIPDKDFTIGMFNFKGTMKKRKEKQKILVRDDANYNFDVYCLQETKFKELDINIGDRSIWKWAANKIEMVLSSIQKEGITFRDIGRTLDEYIYWTIIWKKNLSIQLHHST